MLNGWMLIVDIDRVFFERYVCTLAYDILLLLKRHESSLRFQLGSHAMGLILSLKWIPINI